MVYQKVGVIGMKKPMFSVLVPAYNVSNYLTECLDSVLNQTYDNWEVIVIDDGSSDDTSKICDSFAEKDERFRVFHQKNQGISVTRNRLIRYSRGSYFIFLDSDDFWLDKNMLQIVYSGIIQNNADVVAWWLQFLDNQTKQLQPCENYIPITSITISGEDFLHKMTGTGLCRWWGFLYAINRNLWNGCNVAFKKDRVICEDAEVLFKVLINAKRICTINSYFYCYRMGRESSLTGRYGYNQVKDMMEVAAQNIQYVQQMDISASLKESLCRNFSYLYMDSGAVIYSFDKKKRADGIKLLVKYEWILNYYKDYGNLKNRFKLFLMRLLEVQNAFWVIYVCQRIKRTLKFL